MVARIPTSTGSLRRLMGAACAAVVLSLPLAAVAAGGKAPPTAPRDQKPEALIAELDTDGSGALSAAEWTEPTRVSFRKLDKNKDKFVAEGEFMGWRAPGADKYMTASAFARRRKLFSQADFDLDRRLSEEEFLFQAFLGFKNLDRNRDNQLSLDELSAGTSIDRARKR